MHKRHLEALWQWLRQPINFLPLLVATAVMGGLIWIFSLTSDTGKPPPPPALKALQCNLIEVPTRVNPLEYVGVYCFDLPKGESFVIAARSYAEILSEGQRTQFEFLDRYGNAVPGLTRVYGKYPKESGCAPEGNWTMIRGTVLEPENPGDRYTRVMVVIGAPPSQRRFRC